MNVPRIALESHGDKDRFWKIFDERMAVAHQALQFRIMRCKQAAPVNAPTLFRFGAFGRLGANDSVDQLFRNERATVSLGYIGLYEATSVFYGKNWMRDHGWDPQGKEFALSIVKRMNELCKEWSDAEGYHYSVYSTPAESLTDRFNRMDHEKFGEVEGVTDHDFYTNSFHYPVWLQPTPMEKLNYEKDFPYYASGGFINYCEFPCLQSNPKALEAVWDYAYNIGIGYLARTRRSTAATIADSKATSSPLRKVSSAGVRQLRPGPLQRDQAHLRLLGQPGAAPDGAWTSRGDRAPRQAYERRNRSCHLE